MLKNLLCAAAALTSFANWLPAQVSVLTGTGDPNVDIPAVQTAVNRGGRIILSGHFSFDAPPVTPVGETFARMITVSDEVAISGSRDGNGELTTIDGGFFPFFGEAPGKRIAFEGLHFVHSQGGSIWIYAAAGLTIANCVFEQLVPSPGVGTAAIGSLSNPIFVSSVGAPPTAAVSGHPENFTGALTISNNVLDVGGTASDNTLGIAVFSAGKSPDAEVDVYISGNKISNITERAIDVNLIGGRVYIERNVIATGAVVGPSNGVQPDVIHAVGAGSYFIAHNTLASQWATGAGIRVQGNAGLSEAGATVLDNDITMSAPPGAIFAANSSAIEIRALAQGNSVLDNRIHGSARAALALVSTTAGTPANNTFVNNNLDDFQPSLAGVFIDSGVAQTVIVGAQTAVQDGGAGTIVVVTN